MRARIVLVLVLAAAAAAPLLAGFAGTDLFIPMAGRGAGAYPSNWFTTVYLYNPNPTAVSVDLTFLERNTDNVATVPPRVTDTLAAGETKVYDNIVEATFGKTAYGAIRIQCASKVVASTRVFSRENADTPLTQSFGQDFAATPASFAIGLGESTEILGGYSTLPYQDSAARFNIGCVETTGLGSATVRWVARDGAGQQQKSYDRVVPRLSQTQGFFHQYFDGVDLTNSRVSASVIAGSGKVICYGSLVTNDKEQPKPVQDPTTFEMVYKDSLLGIATVQHDATLTGDGTAGAPLGVAEGGIGTAQLPAQVVTTEKLADAAVTVHKLATSPPPAPGPAGAAVLRADPLEAFFKIGDTMFWNLAFTGDITAVNTAAGSGLSGGTAAGDANLAIAPGGVAGPMLADNAVSSATIADGAVTSTDVAFNYAGSASKGGPATDVACAGGCVSPSEISSAGATAGKVVKYDGTAVAWQADGLSLPLNESVNSAGNALAISNSGGGDGIYGSAAVGAGVWGQGPTGVWGSSGDGVGVRATSTSGVAIYAISPSGSAIHAESASTGLHVLSALNTGTGSAILGSASEGSGVSGMSTSSMGVSGWSTNGTGVAGHTSSAAKRAVEGENTGAGSSGYLGGTHGVYGYSSSGYGVEGYSPSSRGVYGHSDTHDGVRGFTAGAGRSGVYGETTNSGAVAVGGANSNGSYGSLGGTTGVFGTSVHGHGVEGTSSGGHGVYAHSNGLAALRAESGSTKAQAVYATHSLAAGGAVLGENTYYGSKGYLGYGPYGIFAIGAGEFDQAGHFDGSVLVTTLQGTGNRAVYSTSAGTLTNSSSDARLKKDVVDLDDEIDLFAALAGLRGVAFTWDTSQKRAEGLGDQREIGLIAQEVERVLPHVVGEGGDGYKTLDYAKLTAFLIEVVKAQEANIRVQEARIRALEAAQAR